MAHRITLRGAGTRVLGGLQFVDDVAEGELGPNIREYFKAKGAEIKALDTRTSVARTLKRLTKEQLSEYAAERGVEIDENRTNADIADDILDTLFPRS